MREIHAKKVPKKPMTRKAPKIGKNQKQNKTMARAHSKQSIRNKSNMKAAKTKHHKKGKQ